MEIECQRSEAVAGREDARARTERSASRYRPGMKNVHYGLQVLTVSQAVAEKLEQVLHAVLYENTSTVVPLAAWQDEREVWAEVQVGPGISVMIADTWLPDDRPDPKKSAVCIELLEGIRALYEDQSAE